MHNTMIHKYTPYNLNIVYSAQYTQYPLIHRIPSRLRFSIPADATSVCSLILISFQNKIFSTNPSQKYSCSVNSCIPCYPSLSLRVTFCQKLLMLFSTVLSSCFNWVEMLDNIFVTKSSQKET